MEDKELAAKAYYHGLLTKSDLKEMLLENGDWLLLLASAPGKHYNMLSVQTDKEAYSGVKTFVIAKKEGRFHLMENRTFESVTELIEFYQIEKAQMKAGGAPISLARAISRAQWGLEHGDICADSAHFSFNVIVEKDDRFRLMDPRTFETTLRIVELVEFYQKENAPTKVGGAMIKLARAIPREEWELDHGDIEISKNLYEGTFCDVHEGKLKKRKENGREEIINVAVKLAKLDALTKEQLTEFMREARNLRNLDHPNIIKQYGVAAGQDPLMLVMELATDGALHLYLEKNELLPQGKRMEMICQVAWGIDYLHSQIYVHRDIAARNCLYERGTVKIANFGNSLRCLTYQMDPRNTVPIRWLAPETCKTAMYSRATDVWSWGVLVWEIFNNGAMPYPGMHVREVVDYIKGGKHLEIGEKMDNKSVAEMVEKRVFEYVPEDRWTMNQVVKELENMTGLKQQEWNKEDNGNKATFTNAPIVDKAEASSSQCDTTSPEGGSPSITAGK